MNKIIITSLIFFSSLSFAGIKEDLVNAEVKDVKEFTTERCDCKNPVYMGKVCISSTKWGIPDGALFQDPLPLTQFEANIVNEQFTLSSTAYYQRCTYAETAIVFTDPDLQKQFQGKKYLYFEGVDGKEAGMRVSYVRPSGVNGYFDPVTGSFSDEKFWANVGEPMEHYQTYYAGKAIFQRPLSEVISASQVNVILTGKDYIKPFKVWLIIRPKVGTNLISFGEYVVNVRFFKKPGSKPVSDWDITAIGIQVLQ